MAAGLRALGVRVDAAGGEWRLAGSRRAALDPPTDRLRAGRHGHAIPAGARRHGRRDRSPSTATPAARRRPMSHGARCAAAAGRPHRRRSACRSPSAAPARSRGGERAHRRQRVVAVRLRPAAVRGVVHRTASESSTTGRRCRRMPHIEMTVATLRSVGVAVDDSRAATPGRCEPGPVGPWTAVIEPDLSNATPFLAAAAVTGGTVTVPHWPAATTRPATPSAASWPRWAPRRPDRRRADASAGPTNAAAAVDLDLHDVGELTPTVAADRAVRRRAQHDCAASVTCGVTRPTGWPPWPPTSPRSAATCRGTRTALTIRPAAAARRVRGAPTPTTGWRRPARSSGCGSPASSSTTSPPPPRRCPVSMGCGSRMLGTAAPHPVVAALSRLGDHWDNDDVRVRPARGVPAADQDPAHATPTPSRASSRPSTAVATPAWSSRAPATDARGHRDAGPRTRPPGGRGRRPGRPGRRHRRRAGHPGPDRPDRRPRAACCAGRRTTPTRPAERVLVANADQLVIVCALADPVPRTGFIDRCLVAAYTGELRRRCWC